MGHCHNWSPDTVTVQWAIWLPNGVITWFLVWGIGKNMPKWWVEWWVENKMSKLDVKNQELAAKWKESVLDGIISPDPISPYWLEAPRHPALYPDILVFCTRPRSLSQRLKLINICGTYEVISMTHNIFYSTVLFLMC